MTTLTTTPTQVGINTSVTVGCRLMAWYSDADSSGATAHLKLQAISQGTAYTGTNKNYDLTLGSTATGTVAWTDTIPADTWVDVREITQRVNSGNTVGASGKVWTYVYGDARIDSVSLTMPTFSSAPTDLTFNGCTAGPDWYDIGVSISSWGSGGTSDKYIEAEVGAGASTMNEPRRYAQAANTMSATIRVDNSSYGTLNIIPNKEYTIGIYATNGTLNANNFAVGAHCTAPPVLDASARVISGDTVVLDWSFGDQGGKYPLIVQYSMDGTNWVTISTESTSGAKSGSYTLTGLTPATTYTIQTRVTRSYTTQAQYTTAGATVTVTTENMAFYGSVNGATERAEEIYGGKNGQSKRLNKLYGSVGGESKLIHQSFGHLSYV